MRQAARGSARLHRRGSGGRHLRAGPARPRRHARSRLQPTRRRQGLDRHDLAEKIRRARAQFSRTLRRDRGIPRRQRAGAPAFCRRPAERADLAQIRARAHQAGHSAAHLPRRIVLRHRHERAGLRLRPVRRQEPRRPRSTAAGSINGSKIWTSNAHIADYMLGLFRTSPRPRKTAATASRNSWST